MAGLQRWWIFIGERFSPHTHGLMTLALFWGNWAVAQNAAQNVAQGSPPAGSVLIMLLVTLFIFFRLRVFDDIKDYRTDCRINPARPLARGLISIKEAKIVAFMLALVEGLLTLRLGPEAFLVWILLFAYSVLMYREFFIGAWLRPQMELYALAHTLIAIWVGLLIAVAATGLGIDRLPVTCLVFAACNWLVFNVFEFARKTYGRDEEPAHEETYSRRLTPTGAGLLTLMNALGAIAGAWWVIRSLSHPTRFVFLLGILAFISAFLSLWYAYRPVRPQSLWFRQGMALFIMLFYLVTGLCLSP